MKKILIFITILSLLLSSKEVLADDSTTLKFVKDRQSAISSGSDIGLEIDRTIDYNSFVTESMGIHWHFATEPQKEEIARLLKSVVRHSLKRRLRLSRDKKVTWTGEEVREDGLAIVKSVVELKTKGSQEPLEIDYLVKKDVRGIKVIDVIFDGVSTIATYKRQFDKVIRKDGIESLIKVLTEKEKKNLISDDDGC